MPGITDGLEQLAKSYVIDWGMLASVKEIPVASTSEHLTTDLREKEETPQEG